MATHIKLTEHQMEEFWVRHEDATLFCRKQGSGPLLLLIHGVACDADYFRETAQLLAKQFTVITYDRRGYSRSSGNYPENFSVKGQAEDAAEVLRGLRGKDAYLFSNGSESKGKSGGQAGTGIGETDTDRKEDKSDTAFVAGCSAGSIVAAELAKLHPELVRGVFLHEPVFAGDTDMKAELEELLGKLREAKQAGRIIKAMRYFIDAMGGVDKRAKSKSLEKQALDLKNLKIFLDYEMEDFLSYDLSRLSEMKLPVWIAAGESDGEGLFCRAAHSAARIMNWKLVHVPGYHNFASDLPYEFALTISGISSMDPGKGMCVTALNT